MIEINRKAYSQVYSIINYLGEEYKNKLPNNLLKFFEMEKETNYVDDINPITPLEEQDLLQDTIDILAMLKLYYWCKNEEESNKLRNLLNENERKYQMKLREKYNPDNLFKNSNLQKEEIIQNNITNQNMQMIEYKESFFTKIKNWFKRIF